jgi:hypothetical protein
MKLFVIQNICLRCGIVNETNIGLTNSSDTAIYKCENCNFIIFSSWMEDEESES